MQIKPSFCIIAAIFLLICYNANAEPYTGLVSKNYVYIENLIEKGRYFEAQEKVMEIFDENPDDLNARAYLGSIYSAQYKLDAATREYNKVLEMDRNNAAAHNGLGLVYYRRTTSSDMSYRNQIPDLLNNALSEFTLAIKNAPDYYQAYNNAGKILFELGRIPEAESYFNKAIALKPDYSDAVENLGRVLFAKNKPDEAINKYKRSIFLNSKNSSAYYHLGEAFIAKGAYSEAIKQLHTSLYLFPNSAPVHNMLGKAYEMQGNEAAAITEYKKAVMIKPEYTSPYLSLAEIYKNRGDEEFAITELRNAVAVNPGFHEAKSKIAEISLQIGKPDQAIACYKELLPVGEYKNKALKGLARAYFLKAHSTPYSDFVEVEASLKKALRYDPDNLELYLALLRVAKISNNQNQAELYLNKIIKESQDNKISHLIKGEAYLTVKEYGLAEREFIKAINNTNTDNDIMQIGEILIINRAYSPAKIAINRILAKDNSNLKARRLIERIEKNETDAKSKLKVADAFYSERQRKAAIEAYKDALSLNPYLEDAHLRLAKTYEKEKEYNNAVEHYAAFIKLVDVSHNVNKYERKIEKLKKKLQDN